MTHNALLDAALGNTTQQVKKGWVLLTFDTKITPDTQITVESNTTEEDVYAVLLLTTVQAKRKQIGWTGCDATGCFDRATKRISDAGKGDHLDACPEHFGRLLVLIDHPVVTEI